ncbi:YceI family protein [Roseobacter weihaiensis]|uniref:YceI family protein n=1 Tax=Roseobacter weihaiensis TaxID=2763262 RepID=UPI001D0B05A4|nr:YceI family protein [Roseobacter sp. H9]
MHRIATAICAAAAITSATQVRAEPAIWEIDPEHVAVAFSVMHIGYAKTLGRFTDVSGSFVYDPETQELGEVTATIGTASVNTDLEKRDNHVRSADFLDAEAHPMITFTANGGTTLSDTTGQVTGDLTIRGVTQPVTLDVTLNRIAPYPFGHGKETMGISATTSLLRSDFGSTYALPELVGDEIEIVLEFEAIRQE